LVGRRWSEAHQHELGVEPGQIEPVPVEVHDDVRLAQQSMGGVEHHVGFGVELRVEVNLPFVQELRAEAHRPRPLDDLIDRDELIAQSPGMGDDRRGLDVYAEDSWPTGHIQLSFVRWTYSRSSSSQK